MSRKDVAQLLDLVRGQGFEVRRSGGGHWTVVAPGGEQVTVPATPGGPRAIPNMRAALRRLGAVL